MVVRFQSTPPCGGDSWSWTTRRMAADFNPRPLAGATPLGAIFLQIFIISIHAPLRGRPADRREAGEHSRISIHAPLRGRHVHEAGTQLIVRFQSTPPCGGDSAWGTLTIPPLDFNPRPLAGATRPLGGLLDYRGISIHAPLRGRLAGQGFFRVSGEFQSTPPCGGDRMGRP